MTQTSLYNSLWFPRLQAFPFVFCTHLHTRARAQSHCFAAPGMMPALSQLVDSIHRAGLELTWEGGAVSERKGELEPSLLQTKEIFKKKGKKKKKTLAWHSSYSFNSKKTGSQRPLQGRDEAEGLRIQTERSFVWETITPKQILKHDSIYYFNPIRNLSISPSTHSQEKAVKNSEPFWVSAFRKREGGGKQDS